MDFCRSNSVESLEGKQTTGVVLAPAWGDAMAQAAQTAGMPTMSIEAFVAQTMDGARLGPLHWRVLALVASGLFFDVMDFTIFGALVPDLLKSGFVTSAQVPLVCNTARY